MIYDTSNNRILAANVSVESAGVVLASIKVACNTGYQLAGVPVADVVCEAKHSAGAYSNIETTPIDLGTWNGTTQTFNLRFTAASTSINLRRSLPLVVRRF